jgi:Lon protease-like protein
MSSDPAPAPQASEPLPLFPLGTVVFPGALLPLQIFELRYLQMVGECERTGSHFVVVTLTQGGEVHRPGAPAEQFEAVGTRMRLEKVERPHPGLLHIWCRGLERVRVQQPSQRGHGLWSAQVHSLGAEASVPVPPHLAYLSPQMRQALLQIGAPPRPVQAWPEPWPLDDCAWLSDRYGELLPLPVQMKYRLLALPDPLLRLELIGDLVAPASS